MSSGGGAGSQRTYAAERESGRARAQRIAQRRAECRQLDLEHVARLHLHVVGKAQRGGAEEVQVHIARATVRGVLEVVVFQVGQRVAHIVLASDERFFPQHLLATDDAAAAAQVARQLAAAQLRANRADTQLGMRQIQVVLAFGDVVGEFIADGETQPVRGAIRADQVQPDQFRFLAAIECEVGRVQGCARRGLFFFLSYGSRFEMGPTKN